jgi:hypothetical protein
MDAVVSFEEALRSSQALSGPRHVLLGSGFSISYDSTAFSYGRLLDEADFSQLSINARAIFATFGTADFEQVIEVLRTAAVLLPLYAPSIPTLAAAIAADADLLKDALAEVLARRHPDNVGGITREEYTTARTFLAHFERIYTVNYDLLLYWASMQDGPEDVPRNDGFSESEEEPGADWVAWRPMAPFSSQRIFYLHGALHLFDAGTELRKLTFNRTGVALVDQIRGALAQNIYPLVVTEGTSDEKKRKILHSAYLNHAMRSFSSIKGSLFVFGLSLAPNDDHILRRIEKGNIPSLFVGVHGDTNSVANGKVIARAELLRLVREQTVADGVRGAKALSVHYFDSATAHVWRPTP